MNENKADGKWTEIKGEIQQMWGKLTGDELDRTKGNLTAIGGLIEQRYGEAKDAVSEKLNQIFNKGGDSVADTTERAKEGVREASADAKAKLKSEPSMTTNRH